ncbi:ABC transporter permease [Phyllobacterium endophyticum]|uniref:Peptide ABC transporter permease n=1 Tax=Phyllobacterium endophyticum TaxID=1149773 RepID=A0A2P7AKA3_9HYPH|nr:ABC transporter permease [Phyllobacterium endophyticum]MBB3237120.1 peptide/nickel transport system permease protein [Phyllobacterium endophyticum]PSH54651.1 peptide ABC transporter permease [Phyllobacterium endophyticum]TYR40581.1 ABC transporter permease [Phyllobacterium endophyticum]
MLLAVVRRAFDMVFVMFGISVIAFLIFFATPGSDPSARIAGRNATPEMLAQVRASFGFDRPLYVQYGRLMQRLFIARDLTSFVNRGQKVVPAVLQATPVTLSLVFGAAVIWLTAGIGLGIVATIFRGTVIDKGLMLLALCGVSMPVFWFGSVMNLITQSRFHDTWLFSWVPGLGYTSFFESPSLWFKTLVVPWFTLSVLFIGLYARVLRASLSENYQEDYVRTARAKGLSESRIMLRHALRTSLITLLSMFGLDFGALVGGGAILTEVVFNLPGIGRLTYQALQNLDLPFIMATVMYSTFFVVLANALVDVAHAWLDPRVRDAR